MLNIRSMNIFIINVHASIVYTDESEGEDFYEELSRVYDDVSGNKVKIIIKVFNANVEWNRLYQYKAYNV